MTVNAQQIAQSAIDAYDAYVFASVGRSFDGAKADVLALNAAEECRVAAFMSNTDGDFNYFAARHVEFTAIAA